MLKTFLGNFTNMLCSTQQTPSCSKLHVCMLRRATVRIAASGIVGRIVFICTRQSTSVLIASALIIFVRKIPLAAVCKYPRQHIFLSVFSYRVLLAALWSFPRHTSFARESRVLIIAAHITAFIHCRCPSFLAPFFSAAASSASPYVTRNRLLPHMSSYSVIAVSAFHFGTCAFPIAEATQLPMRGVTTFMTSAVQVQFYQSAWRLSHHQPVSRASVCPSGRQVLSVLGTVSNFFGAVVDSSLFFRRRLR